MNASELKKLKQTKVSELYKKFPLSFTKKCKELTLRAMYDSIQYESIILNRNAIITGIIVDE